MDVLTLPTKSPARQIAEIERGFPSSALDILAKSVGLSKSAVMASLQLAPRTVTLRQKNRQRFTVEESQRIARIARVRSLLADVFTSPEAIAQWLETPDRTLGNRTPLSMLVTDLGAAKVENLAKAMVHGVPL